MVFAEKVNELFTSQLIEWELARVNYGLLKNVKIREIDFGRFRFLVQFNPGRIISSSAKVDAQSINERPCFLCAQNRPMQQREVQFNNRMAILVNPFPIFDKHLTIPSVDHIDQRIRVHFDEMLTLAENLHDYVIFYNGPECGASAPDHFHFQAGNRGFLPIEREFEEAKFIESLYVKNGTEIWKWSGYFRTIITLKGSDKMKLGEIFNHLYDNFSPLQPGRPEPMLNILTYYNSGTWIIHIFPRSIHRPSQYFKKGDEQILLSPAAVDLGGGLITPREEDFIKIRYTDIADIFRQVCLEENAISGLLNGLI